MISSESISAFLREDLDIDTSEISKDSALFSSGIIDSFSLISLMAFIEDTGSVRINPAEVTIDNLDSIEKILRFVKSKS